MLQLCQLFRFQLALKNFTSHKGIMGIITFSIPKNIVQAFQKQGQIHNFVETGTYKGDSCFWAATQFGKVYTIEIDPEISSATAARPDCPSNIRFFVGNSRDVLPEVIEELKGRTLFWLDGHWCNVSELGKDDECPLMDELKTLKNLTDAVILIDDARLFLGHLHQLHDQSQWPDYSEIKALLKQQFPRNLITVCDDVIFCIPPDLIKTYKKLRPKYLLQISGANKLRLQAWLNKQKALLKRIIKK